MIFAAGASAASIGLIVTVAVVIVGALGGLALRAANEAAKSRVEFQAGEILELRNGRESDRAEFERKLGEAEDRHRESEQLCREQIAQIRGRLETVTAGFVQQVGQSVGHEVGQYVAGELGRQVERATAVIGDRVIEHVDRGGPT